MFESHEKLLRYTLLANSIFSLVSGVMLILLPNFFGNLVGVEYHYSQMGFSLVIFSILVLYASLRRQLSELLTWIIIAMDVLWVLGSIVLLALPVPLSSTGFWGVIIIALIVSDFALFQYIGIRKAGGAARNTSHS